MDAYPTWFYFPGSERPPPWVGQFIQAVATARPDIESMTVEKLTSDRVLSFLRPGLEGLGYEVEAGKTASQKIRSQTSMIRSART